jgi:hypothetical protein
MKDENRVVVSNCPICGAFPVQCMMAPRDTISYKFIGSEKTKVGADVTKNSAGAEESEDGVIQIVRCSCRRTSPSECPTHGVAGESAIRADEREKAIAEFVRLMREQIHGGGAINNALQATVYRKLKAVAEEMAKEAKR